MYRRNWSLSNCHRPLGTVRSGLFCDGENTFCSLPTNYISLSTYNLLQSYNKTVYPFKTLLKLVLLKRRNGCRVALLEWRFITLDCVNSGWYLSPAD